MGRRISVQEIEDLAIGAAILGAGGGGDPYIGKLMAIKAIREFGDVDLLDPDEVPDDAFIIPTAMMGAPTVMIEKMPAGDETVKALRMLERFLGKKAYATMPIEAGGLNSTIPFNVAARTRLPVVDADGMGRAFPELQMESFHIYGLKGTPMCLFDERGNYAVLETVDNFMLEWIARGITVKMGGTAHMAEYTMTGAQVKKTAIRNTASLAIRLGEAARITRTAKANPIEAVLNVGEGTNYGKGVGLFKGKITDLDRKTTAGFAVGRVTIEGFDEFDGRTMSIRFQNENLVATIDGSVVATVPDIISILDSESGFPVTTEGLRYGYRVTVIGIPTPEIMRTPEALAVWGPKYFGYKEVEYRPLELIHADYYRGARLPPEKEERYRPLLERTTG